MHFTKPYKPIHKQKPTTTPTRLKVYSLVAKILSQWPDDTIERKTLRSKLPEGHSLIRYRDGIPHSEGNNINIYMKKALLNMHSKGYICKSGFTIYIIDKYALNLLAKEYTHYDNDEAS